MSVKPKANVNIVSYSFGHLSVVSLPHPDPLSEINEWAQQTTEISDTKTTSV